VHATLAALILVTGSHGKGWFLSFRDAGRSFYVYLYPGRAGDPSIALAILDSLRIRALPASV